MNVRWKGVIAILLIGLLTGLYEFYDLHTNEEPKLQQAEAQARTKLSQDQAELGRLKTFAQNIQAVKQEFSELNLQLDAALEHMPRNFNFAALLRKMTLLAHDSGVEISEFTPAKDEEKVKDEFYSTIHIDFAMRGTFTQMLVFFDQLSRLKRIINIDSIEFSPKEGDARRSGGVLASAKVKIKTFRFSE